MNREEYEAFKKTKGRPIVGGDLSNHHIDRTVMSGYTVDRVEFRVDLEGGKLVCYVNGSQVSDETEITDIQAYVPSKRAYVEECDFEFCELLTERGAFIAFRLPDTPEWRDPIHPKDFT